jgi:3-(3-hydroxy-phenyl)propionate hydroxylase
VFIAGDAAHQTPPFFGQGMCHGVRDVANLAWKFALVSQGKASPALLDTYQTEREPHVRAVIDAAIAAGRYICERDPQVARQRDETLRAAMGKPAPASASDLIPPIRSGIVSAADQAGRGARFIQPQVAFDGRRMLLDGATGGGFVLLASSRAVLAALTAGQWELWNRLGGKSFVIDRDAVDAGSIHDVDGDLRAWLAASGSVAVLVRPDFYVYGVAGSAGKTGKMIEELAAALRMTR